MKNATNCFCPAAEQSTILWMSNEENCDFHPFHAHRHCSKAFNSYKSSGEQFWFFFSVKSWFLCAQPDSCSSRGKNRTKRNEKRTEKLTERLTKTDANCRAWNVKHAHKRTTHKSNKSNPIVLGEAPPPPFVPKSIASNLHSVRWIVRWIGFCAFCFHSPASESSFVICRFALSMAGVWKLCVNKMRPMSDSHFDGFPSENWHGAKSRHIDTRE